MLGFSGVVCHPLRINKNKTPINSKLTGALIYHFIDWSFMGCFNTWFTRYLPIKNSANNKRKGIKRGEEEEDIRAWYGYSRNVEIAL